MMMMEVLEGKADTKPTLPPSTLQQLIEKPI